jgi:DNA modification methylase
MGENITLIDPRELTLNASIMSLYTNNETQELRDSIRKHGMLQPILVNEPNLLVISGNLRVQVALELQWDSVPVILISVDPNSIPLLSIHSNIQRRKTNLDYHSELLFIENYFPVSQGSRSDLDVQLKEESKLKKEALTQIPRYKVDKIKKAMSLSNALYGDDGTDKLKLALKKVDDGNTTLNRLVNNLEEQLRIEHNKRVIPEVYEFHTDHVHIYNHSSEGMKELANKSVDLVVTSPPYYMMRMYGYDVNQIGQERSHDDYIKSLLKIFSECHRVLKDDGSLFVNINEKVEGGFYQGVVHQFVGEMLKNGWDLNDEIIWLKNNPVYTEGNRTVRSHEYIFHFVKKGCTTFYYDSDLAKNISDPKGFEVYGFDNKPKFFSAIQVENSTIRTTVSNTGKLRNQCKKEGLNLFHSATFPLDLPTFLVLLGSKPGDLVLDPYSGTASVAEVCQLTGRKFVGYETCAEYVMASEIRLKNIAA